MEELNSLPYLDNVVRETLRAHTPLVSVRRMALVDEIIPLSTPYTSRKGVVHDNIPVRKGQQLHLSLLGVNTDKALWGEDAAEVKPERWDNLPEGVKAIPGVWSNLMTFFSGPHNCIGFRFSVAEQKALLFTFEPSNSSSQFRPVKSAAQEVFNDLSFSLSARKATKCL